MNIKWIVLNGMMTAVNPDTGEIVNHKLACLPDAFNVDECVTSVLSDADVPVIPNAEINPQEKAEKRGRKPTVVNNPFASIFSNAVYYEDTGASSLGVKLDDLIYSVSRANTSCTSIPVKQLMLVLKMAEISAKGIQEMLNKRRALKESNLVGERYARTVREAAANVINRLMEPESKDIFQLNSGATFSFEIDAEAYERSDERSNAVICPVEFSESDKRSLRFYAISGQDEKAQCFVNQITDQCGRMLERKEGKIVPVEEIYQAMQVEFPDIQAEKPVAPKPVKTLPEDEDPYFFPWEKSQQETDYESWFIKPETDNSGW